jgi:hypothetical protein
MAYELSFKKELSKAFEKRTNWLRTSIFSKKPGKPPAFTRKTVNKTISKLQDIVSNALSSKLARTEFNNCSKRKMSWHVKGRGPENKKVRFDEWFNNKFSGNKSVVYVFWGNNRCIYVGRTGNGGERPSKHFEKHWFNQVKRIDIYSARTATYNSKLECLAQHYFQPIKNKYKASKPKYMKSCPLCIIHKNIKKELRQIFRFK